MAEHAQELIIIRRAEEEEHEHHSSAWKVAHADFMTAMMAFFLIMWLINVTDDNVRKGIAQYFNPIHMSQGSTELKGLSKVDPGKDAAPTKSHGETPLPGASINLIELTPGHADSKSVSPEDAANTLKAVAEAAAKLAAAADKAGDKAGTAGDKSGAAAEGDKSAPGTSSLSAIDDAAAALEAGNGKGDQAAFQDPYAILAKLAAQYATSHPTSANATEGDSRDVGVAGGDIDRDPFDPTYWQLAALPPARTDKPGAAGSAAGVSDQAIPDAAASQSATLDAKAPADASPPAQTVRHVEPPAVAKAAPANPPVTADAKADNKNELPAETVARSQAIAADIAKSVQGVMAADASPDIAVMATREGVVVSLTDDAVYSMFPVGSAVPDAKTVVLIDGIAKALSSRPGQIVIRGYTDGRPFHSADYDNWRLSAARAHMAYYMLTRSGLDENRVVSIEGHADRVLKNTKDPFAAENRRIEILLRETP